MIASSEMISALFLLLMGSQTPTPKPATPPPPAAASAPFTVRLIDGHIVYTVPAGLAQQAGIGDAIVKQETDKQGASAVVKAAASCVSLPVLAMDTSENFRMATIMRLDAKCLGTDISKSPLDSLATAALTESLQRMGGGGKLSPPQTYKLGGHDAVAVRGSLRSDKLGVTFQAVVTCTTAQQDALCWEFMSLAPEVMEALITQPVQIDGGAPIPVVPKDIFTGLKIADTPKL